MSTVCVACSTESTGMINIYMHPLELDVMFSEITGVNSINPEDHLCVLCYDRLKDAHNFRKKCQQNYLHRHKELISTEPSSSNAITSTEDTDFDPDSIVLLDNNEYPHEDLVTYAPSDQDQPREEEETNDNAELIDDDLEVIETPTAIVEEHEDTKNPINPPMTLLRRCRKKRCKNPDVDIFNSLEATTCECCFEQFDRIEDKEAHLKQHLSEEKPYRCKQLDCQSRFKDRSGIRNHYRAHVEGKKYACSMCPQVFTQKGNLTVHQRIHQGLKPFACLTCGKCFSENGNLKTHMRHHTDERPYKCNYCEKRYRTHYSHKIHERSHTNERPFGCDLCGKCFSSSGKLANHRRIHTNDRKYVCTESGCKAAFIESNGLRRHRLTHNKTAKGETPTDATECPFNLEPPPVDITVIPENNTYVTLKPVKDETHLPAPSDSDDSSTSLSDHGHKASTQCCLYCDKTYDSQKRYIKHVAKQHPSKKPFKCKVCDHGLTRLSALREHMNQHTDNKPFQCPVCFDVFAHKKALSRHREIHANPPSIASPKKCRLCRDEFYTEEQYLIHKTRCKVKAKHLNGKSTDNKKPKQQAGERPFICTVCGMGLSRLTSLNEHMNTHTGEKPFVCTLCKERFLNSKALLRHRDKHDSKNPKSCRKCQQEFGQWEDFRAHVNQMACQVKLSVCHVCQETFTRVIDFETHYKFCHSAEQKLYSCDQCGKKLSHKSHLNAHIRTHDTQSALICATCGRQFVGENQLKRHIASAHSEPKCPYNCPVCQMGQPSLAALISHTKTHVTGDDDESQAESLLGNLAMTSPMAQLEPYQQVADPEMMRYADPNNYWVEPSPPMPPPTVPPLKIKLERGDKRDVHPSFFDVDTDFQNFDDNSQEESTGKAGATASLDDEQQTVKVETVMDQLTVKPEVPSVQNTAVTDTDDSVDNEEKRRSTKEKPAKKRTAKRRCSMPDKTLTKGRRPRNFSCEECDKKFDSAHKLKNHHRVHTKESPYECYLCGLKMRFYGSLKGHMYRHMNLKPIQCTYADCEQTFKRKEQLMVHMIKHTGVKPWLCQICGKGYATEKILEKHRKIHGEAIYKCPICDRAFTQKFKVPLHMKTHSDQPSYVCHECGAPFRNRWSMQQHMKRHQLNVVFKCKYCDKQFVLHSALSAHLRSHTGEKGYSCSTCHKVFTKTRALKMHERLHTGEKPFKCDWPDCTAEFRMKITLSTHYRIHTGEKPYPCKYCEKEFTTSSNLARHLDAMHESQVLADAGIENAVCTGTKLGMEIAVVD